MPIKVHGREPVATKGNPHTSLKLLRKFPHHTFLLIRTTGYKNFRNYKMGAKASIQTFWSRLYTSKTLRKCLTKVEDQTFRQSLDDLLQLY